MKKNVTAVPVSTAKSSTSVKNTSKLLAKTGRLSMTDAVDAVLTPFLRPYETTIKPFCSPIDIAERDYRARCQPNYREEVRIETTVERPSIERPCVEPTYTRDFKPTETVDYPRYELHHQKARMGYYDEDGEYYPQFAAKLTQLADSYLQATTTPSARACTSSPTGLCTRRVTTTTLTLRRWRSPPAPASLSLALPAPTAAHTRCPTRLRSRATTSALATS